MKALVLGSGAALPARGRFNTTLAFMQGARTLLFDCAQPASELLFHHGVDYASVDTIVLSHMHADHVTSIGQLAHMKHHFMDPVYARSILQRTEESYKSKIRHPAHEVYDQIKPGLKIYVPAGVEKVINDYMVALYMRPEVFTNFSLEVLPYGAGLVHEDEDFKITAYANDHIRTYYPELEGTDAVRDSFTLMVESSGRKCLYSSDLAAMNEIESMAGEADLVFVEGAHFGADAVIDLVRRLELQRVCIHHVIAYREDEFAEMKTLLEKANIQVTFDGFEIEV